MAKWRFSTLRFAFQGLGRRSEMENSLALRRTFFDTEPPHQRLPEGRHTPKLQISLALYTMAQGAIKVKPKSTAGKK
jgi:hypothetical protein